MSSANYSQAAGLISKLDWLSFSAGNDRTQFTLIDDSGLPVAQAQIQLTSGLLIPLSPSAGILHSDFWVTPPDFEDSVSGNGSVATTKIQVAPQSGLVQYRLTLTGTDLTGMVFGVGQLYGITGSGRSEITARTSTALEVPVNLLGAYGWDDGIRSYTEAVTWDTGLQVLSTGPSANGESAVSFFKVTDVGSPVTQLSFYFPNGHNGATGDAVEFAFGMTVVPEPSITMMMLAGITIFVGSRRRR